MADPVSVSLGVIPLIGITVKSFTVVYKKLSTFIDYSSTVKLCHKKLRRQRRMFENECHLLLRFAIDDDTNIGLMRVDTNHPDWANDSIDLKLRERLGANYETCLESVLDIQGAISEIQGHLNCFDVLQDCRLEVSLWGNRGTRIAVSRLLTV